MTRKTDQVMKISKWFVTMTIGGFHLTSSPPCWFTEQTRKKSFRNLTLNIIMQNIRENCHFVAHQHGCLITWLKTIYRVHVHGTHGHKSNQKRHKNNLRSFFKLLNAISKPRTWRYIFWHYLQVKEANAQVSLPFFIYFQPVYNLMFPSHWSFKFIFRSQHIFS